LENPHTPFMHRRNQVVYTGTHDNAPTRGWFREAASWEEKNTLAGYSGAAVTEENAAAVLIRLALASVADMAVVPVQDILGLGQEARMNTPSTTEGNWRWRLLPGQFSDASMAWFMESAAFFGRSAGIRDEA
jgi:4-alpha-glucanotransferase